jgi:hypothetical protein
MLMAHSYAFRNNLNYGGVCPDKEREVVDLYNQSLLIHQNVIDDLELSEIFLVDCPAEQSNETMIQRSEYWTPKKSNRKIYGRRSGSSTSTQKYATDRDQRHI